MLTALATTPALSAVTAFGPHSGFGPHYGWGGGPGWLFFLIPLFWVALIVLIASIFGRRWRRRAMAGGFGPWSHGVRGAEASLSERFAQGEIDEAEYTSRLAVLRANNGGQKNTSA